MTDPDVLDPEVEGYLRRAFAGDAARAPLPADLGGEAVRRARVHRRRSAVAGSVLALVVVAVGVAVVQQAVPSAEGTTPAAPHEGSPVPSGPALPSQEPVLMFRGVEVPVPASMLDPANVHCGTPIADAAYVIDNTLGVRDCLVAEPPGLTLVVMQPLEDVSEAERNPGGRTLDDGRYQVASAIPGRDIWLTVTSPDPDRADRLFGGAVIASDPRGCAIHPAMPNTPAGGPIRVAPMSGGMVGQVCGYRAGWLTGAALVSGAQLTELAALVGDAPSDGLLDCPVYRPGVSGWWIVLGDTKVWVEGGGCNHVVADSGAAGLLTDALVSRLWQLAAGPATFTGLATAKSCTGPPPQWVVRPA